MNAEDFVYGIHAVAEAFQAGKTIDRVVLQRGIKGEQLQSLIRELKQQSVEIRQVPLEAINKITRKNHQGIVAFISPTPFYKLDEIIQACYDMGKDPLVLVLDKITDVRNFGAICRSALAFGADAVVIPSQNAARIGSDAMKTSAGALHTLKVCKTSNLKADLLYLSHCGCKLVAATEKGNEISGEGMLSGPVALLMGSEETGISPEYLKMCNLLVRIPIGNGMSSLNVSVAAGIMLYEVCRQRAINHS
ncbi:MAG: 23S rRNA (guanosine(2251)-2'-O)-methyltransferase RlmB [Bacteroidota bacterium]|jgi:23S rRNA (guanosine2251-2'-O)-methyltransferase